MGKNEYGQEGKCSIYRYSLGDVTHTIDKELNTITSNMQLGYGTAEVYLLESDERLKDATCTQPGYTGDQYCIDCDTKIKSGSALEATGHKSTKLQGVKDVTCTEDGYDGDLVCTTCGDVVQAGQVITAPGSHTFGDWKVITEATETEDGAKERSCSNCEYTERETIPATKTEDVTDSETEGNQTQDEKEPTNPWIVGTAIVVPSGCVIGAVVAVLLKRRNHR